MRVRDKSTKTPRCPQANGDNWSQHQVSCFCKKQKQKKNQISERFPETFDEAWGTHIEYAHNGTHKWNMTYFMNHDTLRCCKNKKRENNLSRAYTSNQILIKSGRDVKWRLKTKRNDLKISKPLFFKWTMKHSLKLWNSQVVQLRERYMRGSGQTEWDGRRLAEVTPEEGKKHKKELKCAILKEKCKVILSLMAAAHHKTHIIIDRYLKPFSL